jgi:hypothetical protein
MFADMAIEELRKQIEQVCELGSRVIDQLALGFAQAGFCTAFSLRRTGSISASLARAWATLRDAAHLAIGSLEHVDNASEAVFALARRTCRPGSYGITSRPRTNRDQIPLIFHDSKRHVRAPFRRELPTCGKTELQRAPIHGLFWCCR